MEKERKRMAEGRKKLFIVIGAVVMTAAVIFLGVKFTGGEENVSFEEVKENKVPADISSDVIPEYRTLERALACRVDDDIYVMVTRGEKPTSGFGVSVDRMIMEEKDGKTNLIVYSLFEDPDKETPISQIITYPLCIVKTDLTALPDTIELRIQY